MTPPCRLPLRSAALGGRPELAKRLGKAARAIGTPLSVNLARLAILLLGLLAACGGPEPTPAPSMSSSATAEWLSCTGPGYSVTYPPGWFVHPRDDRVAAAECSLFAQRPFGGQREGDGGWTGAQVVLTIGASCRGTFEQVASEKRLQIQGFPAWARQLLVGEGPTGRQPSAYEYFVNLAPQRRCEEGRWFVGRTEVDSPGDDAQNMRVLDTMMASVRFAAQQ